MVVAVSHGLPVGLCTERASPHEVKLVNSTLVAMVILEAPQNRVGDDAYDSDKLDAELRQFGIELIARHRSNRKNKSQDGRLCGGVGDDGRLNGCSLGCRTFGDLWFGTRGIRTIS